MIKIDYDPRNFCAVILADPNFNDYIWAEIRFVYEMFDPALINEEPKKLAVPWWIFLASRNNLNYVFSTNEIIPEFSEMAKKNLIVANKRIQEYFANQINIYSHNKIESLLKEKGFTRKLTENQTRDLNSLLNYSGAANFSVPGAGKTAVALAYFFLKKRKDTKLLVVSPKNAFAPWEEELGLCLPQSKAVITRLQGGEYAIKQLLEEDPTISLITYQQLSRVKNIIENELFQKEYFMFLDESHKMKRGGYGVYGSSILEMAHLPYSKLLLSGTPMPNSITDLIPQFIFLYPEIPVSEETIVERIRRIYVRTTKPELKLPPVERRTFTIPMNPFQRTLYENIRSEFARQLENYPITDLTILRTLGHNVTRLIQVTTNPALIAESELRGNTLLTNALNEGDGPKVQEACKLARLLAVQGKKCIIWSQFVRIVESIADQLQDLGAVFIHGQIETDEDEENTESREALIRKFHDDPRCMVMVANPAACGEGISLHRICHHAIYVDRNYNAAHYLQSEDRIHRLGLKANEITYITILSCADSIDSSIARRLEHKVREMGRVLDDRNLNIETLEISDEITGLSQQDLEDLRKSIVGGTR